MLMKINSLNGGILFFYFLLIASVSAAQTSGIEGYISNEQGEKLGFATIYIRNIESGTTTNSEGYFQVKLNPGKYDIVFQYLGYQTLVKFIQVENQFQELNIILSPISYELSEVSVRADKEDPAYTIMRKAIAKSDYHRQQLNSYSARVYIKGSGRLLDSPFFLRKRIAKEGIDSTTAFTSESITDIEYIRPNTYKQNVISIRSSGNDNNTSPNEFIFGSFYEPKINDAISPLSPRAFAYYRFKYMGSFVDRGYTINMIKVIPKSKGDNLFSGDLFITDDLYSIYSFDLSTQTYGINLNLKLIYGPVNEKVWMPINYQFKFEASIMGFDVVYDYLAVVSDYKIEINPDLDHHFELIDENIEADKAEDLESKKEVAKENPLDAFNGEEELTRKQLNKIVKEYEKQELAESNSKNITLITDLKIDSLASKKDPDYWNSVRPVPLTNFEVNGYQKLDSIAEVDKKEAMKDSLKNNKEFQWFDIFLGGGYSLGKKHHLKIDNMLGQINYNTVDGFYFGYKMAYDYSLSDKNKLSFIPKVRYATSRKAWTGGLKIDYGFGKALRRGNVFIDGGRFTSQINGDDPISEYNNVFTTLVLKQNFMKIYEKNYILAGFQKQISDKVDFKIQSELSERRSLKNTSDFTFFNWDNREFGSNNPNNIEMGDTDFPVNQAWISEFEINYRPWLKFTIKNGKKKVVENSSPEFGLSYVKGIATDFSIIDFDRLQLSYKQKIKVGAGSVLSLNVKIGSTFNNSNMTFVDYEHFMGNRSPFETNDPVASYRLLPYYDYSTNDEYLVGHLHYHFRKFLLTQIALVRFAGLGENLFVNYLGTNNSGNYTELGYGIDNIFRIFRIEGILSFQDGKFIDSGLRIGISTVIDFN